MLPLTVADDFHFYETLPEVDANIVLASCLALPSPSANHPWTWGSSSGDTLRHLEEQAGRPGWRPRGRRFCAPTSEVGSAVFTAVATTAVCFLPVFPRWKARRGKLFQTRSPSPPICPRRRHRASRSASCPLCLCGCSVQVPPVANTRIILTFLLVVGESFYTTVLGLVSLGWSVHDDSRGPFPLSFGTVSPRTRNKATHAGPLTSSWPLSMADHSCGNMECLSVRKRGAMNTLSSVGVVGVLLGSAHVFLSHFYSMAIVTVAALNTKRVFLGVT